MELFEFVLTSKDDSYEQFVQGKSSYSKKEIIDLFEWSEELNEKYLEVFYNRFLTGLDDPSSEQLNPEIIIYYSKQDEPNKELYNSDGEFHADIFERDAT